MATISITYDLPFFSSSSFFLKKTSPALDPHCFMSTESHWLREVAWSAPKDLWWQLKYELQHALLKLEAAKGFNNTVKGTHLLYKCKTYLGGRELTDVPQSITKNTKTQLSPSVHADAIIAKYWKTSNIILMLNMLATKIKMLTNINDEGGLITP